MIKLLITLAAVAAIAAASTSATVEFPDLEDWDADGLQDDVADDEVDVADNVEDSHQSHITSPYSSVYDDRLCHRLTVNRVLRYRSDSSLLILQCPLGHFRTWSVSRLPLEIEEAKKVSRCRLCPRGTPATTYGKYAFNCGVSSCYPCDPGLTFRREFGMCLTARQFRFLRSMWGDDDDIQVKMRESLGGGEGNHTVTLQSQVQTLQEDLQENEEAVSSCCLAGFYGTPPNCRECPERRPSSPYPAGGGPASGVCPNRGRDSCFQCNPCFEVDDRDGICKTVSGCTPPHVAL